MRENTPFSYLYRTRINPDGTTSEVIGYWVIVVGTLLALVGIGVFLSGSTYVRGDIVYWQYRQLGIVLAAVGLPLTLLGMTFRLPLQPAGRAIGGIGLLPCSVAIVWFIQLYPNKWTLAGPGPVLLTYVTGLVILVASFSIVPLTTAPAKPERKYQQLPQPYYQLHEQSNGWEWTLHSEDDSVLAESALLYPDRKSARRALEALSGTAPVAGTEVGLNADTGADASPIAEASK